MFTTGRCTTSLSTTTTTTTDTATTVVTPTVLLSITGYFQLNKASDNSFYGYIAVGNGETGASIITTDINSAERFSLSGEVLVTGGTWFDIPIIDPPAKGFFGATQGINSQSGDLATNTYSCVTIADVDEGTTVTQIDNSGYDYYQNIRTLCPWSQNLRLPVNCQLLSQSGGAFLYGTANPTSFTPPFDNNDILRVYFEAQVWAEDQAAGGLPYWMLSTHTASPSPSPARARLMATSWRKAT
ncbi:hypothetical protein OC845_006897 [Tilletia horrida]|nr:hypothetical protein OC845_006897 [Tilletia horrida]